MEQLDPSAAEQAPPGYHDDKDASLKRLRRVEGQVRGLQHLVQQDQYCIDVLTQVAATTKALQAVAVHLLEDHLKHCVQEAVTAGGDEARDKVAEASQAVARFLRT
ncbi:metal-sensitive transcriptional regulator [Streptomyces sp. NBC_01613]|uniref:metal-sensitive transcriptional regulator n=1 Tax=Streptomyces sp. NBC_01613 TaxID=2975896 RepID=UPI00386FC39B